MTDTLKEQIVIQAIKCYKNREEWKDEYIQEKYAVAIEYMLENFDKLFGSFSGSGSSSGGSATPIGARVTKIKQGEREINYEYGSTSSSTVTTNGLNSTIENDVVLSALLGKPLIRVM